MGESGRYWKKEKDFLLDAPVSPSELFGISVKTVVEKFREAKACSSAFKTLIPRRSRSETEQCRGPGPSPSGDQRWAQKASVAARAPPPPAGRGSKRGRQDLREVIQTRHSQRLVRTRVRLEHLLPSLGGPVICPHLPLSNSPAANVNST